MPWPFSKKTPTPNLNLSLMDKQGRKVATELIHSPAKFLAGKAVEFAGVQGENVWQGQTTTDPRSLTRAGVTAQSKEFPENVSFDVVFQQAKSGGAGDGTLTFFRNPNGAETHCRALPWEEDWVYYMRLDDKAKFWATGPLTGCHVYIAGTRRNPWVFHANSNANDTNMELNMHAKRVMSLNVLAGGIDPDATGLRGVFERTSYSTKGYGGFVFGYRPGKEWKFYAYLRHATTKAVVIRPIPF